MLISGIARPQKKGLADAEFHLGWLYDNGKGVGQSYRQAAFWYEKAALGGHGIPAAKYNLGLLYEYGRGVQPFQGEFLSCSKSLAVET
jgi:TPR repeat protein